MEDNSLLPLLSNAAGLKCIALALIFCMVATLQLLGNNGKFLTHHVAL